MGAVYSITNTQTGQKYIGSTIGLIRKRWNAHKNQLRRGIHSNTRLQESWTRCGEDTFAFEVLEECDAVQARFLEKQRVEKEDPYFNIIPVGALPDSRRRLKEHEIQKLRDRFKGIPLTPEHRKKIAQANTGFKHSDETKKRMSELKKGSKWSQERREKARNRPKKGAFWEFNGESKRLSEWAKTCGVDAHILRTRIANGWPPEKVLTPKKFVRYVHTPVTIGGDTKTVKEFADSFGIKMSMVHDRIKKGWAIEKAITTPKRG
jgi:group I intron endonuclease